MESPFDPSSLFPRTNRHVAERLFVLEVGLREFIIETLTALDGSQWYKKGLPADVTAKYLRGRLAERASTWTTHIPHHPLYYIDFPDLEKVLSTNWARTFQSFFSPKKDIFLGALRSLEPIRNTVAHNRNASQADLNIVEGVLSQFQSALGAGKLTSLVERCTCEPSLKESIQHLADDIEAGRIAILALEPPPSLRYWPTIRSQWWFDSAYLTGTDQRAKLDAAKSKVADAKTALARAEADLAARSAALAGLDASGAPVPDVLEPIVHFFSLVDAFATVPRTRGSGHLIEAWCKTHNIPASAENALGAIAVITESVINE